MVLAKTVEPLPDKMPGHEGQRVTRGLVLSQDPADQDGRARPATSGPVTSVKCSAAASIGRSTSSVTGGVVLCRLTGEECLQPQLVRAGCDEHVPLGVSNPPGNTIRRGEVRESCPYCD
jgi:hypothetical protein